ncbi:MAG: hypothetical protein KC636_20440 [Myxococcales bacterium]|nr:hypothetical protein [Myxococcales bacterium]
MSVVNMSQKTCYTLRPATRRPAAGGAPRSSTGASRAARSLVPWRRSSARRRAVCGALGLTAALALPSRPAAAHHTPGHGASEGVRTINSIGGTGGRAKSRLLLLNETTYTGQGLNPGVTHMVSLYGEYAPVPAFSIAAQAPLLIIASRDSDYTPRVGYGNTRVSLRVTPHARKLTHRVLSTGINLSFPTRTVKLTVDPGKVWGVAPYLIFTRTYSELYWQLIGLSTLDIRPAGLSVDLSAGGQVGALLLSGKLTAGFGALVDVRLLNWKALAGGGYEFTSESRPGEGTTGSADARPIGATRVTALATAAYNFAKWGSLTLSLQLPLTAQQDFTVGGGLGFQVFF